MIQFRRRLAWLALLGATLLAGCGDDSKSAEEFAEEFCDLLNQRNNALVQGNREEFEDLVAEAEMLSRGVSLNDISDTEMEAATREKCPDLIENVD